MKRLIYTFALLFFFFGVIEAHDLIANSKMYFAKPDNWSAQYVQFMIGHDSYSQGYAMSSISNTKLYYVNMPSWGGYNGWAVLNTNESVWGGSGEKFWDRYAHAENETNAGWTALGSCNLINMNGGDKGFTALTDYKSLNKTHTIKTQLDNTDNANVGDVTAKYYQLTSETSTGDQKSSSITAASGTISVVYTSQVTLTATPVAGYTFLGWYVGETRKESSTTYTYIAENSATTVIAKFTKQPTVLFTNDEIEVNVGYKFIPTVESSNLTNPRYTYTVSFNGGASQSVDASGYVMNEKGKYEFTVVANGDNSATARATYIINTFNLYVVGTEELCGNAWDQADANNLMIYEDGVFTKTYTNVPRGNYEFKVFYDENWLGYDKVDKNSSHGCTDNGGNIFFELGGLATVQISYNKKQDEIVLKYIHDNFLVGEKFYYSPKTEGVRYAAYLFGIGGDTWVDMAKEYSDVYSFIMPEGDWNGLIYCEMKSGTAENNWDNKKTQSADLHYNGEYTWYVESADNNYWRKFENLIYAGQKLYFKPDKNWESKGARFAAYYWDISGENRWANCVYDSVDHAYHVVAPTVGEGVNRVVWTNIKFVCMNSKPQNDWANKLYETPNLVYNGTEDFFIIKLNDAKDLNSADKDNWISFSHPFKGAIFFEPNASLKATANKRFSIYLWNGFDENCWVKMQPLATHPDIYCVIIPEGYWTGANICSMNPDNEINGWDKDKNDKYLYLLNQTDNLTYHSDKLLYRVPETWEFNKPANQHWMALNLPKAEDIDCSGDITAGIYYTYFKRTLSISTPEDIAKWHWISLPYNVKISDIKGGVYGTDFIIQKYDTEARAKWENNIATENESAWCWMDDSETLLAGKGYILAVSDAKDSYSLTFVSETDLNVVSDRFESNNIDYSSAVAESANWHLVGTGVYGSVGDYEGVNYVAVPQSNGNDYDYYSLSEGSNNRLAPYSAFFVQYAGDYSFTKASGEQPALAPRLAKKVDDVERYYVDIKGESEEAQTAIFLAVDGTEDYVVGQDFLHLGASGASLQLYSLQGQNILSFNYLQSVERTIALGGYIAKGGIYEISLRAIGNATSIVLYDKFTGEGIDLLSDTYEFEAEKGAIDGRFEIIISYAQQGGTTTELSGEDFGNLSVLLNNELVVFEGLTLGEDVMIYDVMGRCVKLFKATEQKAEICLVGGAYLLHHNNETIKFIVNK